MRRTRSHFARTASTGFERGTVAATALFALSTAAVFVAAVAGLLAAASLLPAGTIAVIWVGGVVLMAAAPTVAVRFLGSLVRVGSRVRTQASGSKRRFSPRHSLRSVSSRVSTYASRPFPSGSSK